MQFMTMGQKPQIFHSARSQRSPSDRVMSVSCQWHLILSNNLSKVHGWTDGQTTRHNNSCCNSQAKKNAPSTLQDEQCLPGTRWCYPVPSQHCHLNSQSAHRCLSPADCCQLPDTQIHTHTLPDNTSANSSQSWVIDDQIQAQLAPPLW